MTFATPKTAENRHSSNRCGNFSSAKEPHFPDPIGGIRSGIVKMAENRCHTPLKTRCGKVWQVGQIHRPNAATPPPPPFKGGVVWQGMASAQTRVWQVAGVATLPLPHSMKDQAA